MSTDSRTAGAERGAVQQTRYCPLCNRRTLIVRELQSPFIILRCTHCGFVHLVIDEPELDQPQADDAVREDSR